tara:strand:+ start:405 stop:1343 length:939 start_codon:yes stop_codon:yes gene_type:complete
MARTSKSRGKSGFRMKSGNTTSFKAMGSSPTKFTNPATGQELNPYAPDIISNMGNMGVSGDVMEEIIKNKLKEKEKVEKKKIDEGTKIDPKKEIKENVAEIKEVDKPKLKGGSYAFGESEKDYKKNRKAGESKYEYQVRKKKEDKLKNKGLKDLTGTKDKDPVDLTKPQTGPRETGSGGASFTPPETSELSFSDVFSRERKKQGPGGEFEYKGKKYTTDRADDKDYGKFQKGEFEMIKNFKTSEVKTPEVKTVEEELKKKGFDFNKKFDFSNKGGYDFSITDEFNNPIYKKSPHKKYGRTAKGNRGFKMKRK